MADIIQFRRDTVERWSEFNPILAEGEIGFILGDSNYYKIGDGVRSWNDLPLKGFNGNIEEEFGERDDSVISQKGITNLFKYIVSNNSHIDISSGWNVLDNFGENYEKALQSCGMYVLINNHLPVGYMFMISDTSKCIIQWIFGDVSIEDGQIINSSKDANILFRSIYWDENMSDENRGIITEWKFLHNNFIFNNENEINAKDELKLSPSVKVFKNSLQQVDLQIQNVEKGLSADYTKKIDAVNLNNEKLNAKYEQLEKDCDNFVSIKELKSLVNTTNDFSDDFSDDFSN